jgi:hypothetical protein
MWLTSSQKLRIQTSQRNLGSADSQSSFDKPSIVLTSDRLLFNAKNDHIILSAKKSVNISTPNWAMDMDKLFTEIQKLVDEVIKLNENVDELNGNVEKAHTEYGNIAQNLSTAQVTTLLGPQPLLNFAAYITSKIQSETNKVETQLNKQNISTNKQNIETILQNIDNMKQ